MNATAKLQIIDLLDKANATYLVLCHEHCATSEESARAREAAGAPAGTIGAKAILVALDPKRQNPQEPAPLATIVIPGISKLDTRAVRALLPSFKRFRFATISEMETACGVRPGCMPPFGQSIFSAVRHLVVDSTLANYEWLGFNVADHTSSVVVRSEDYFRVVAAEAIVGEVATVADINERRTAS